jgi:succinate dehydrogenase / fumarate reductase flavoprotein subunit
MTTIPGLFVLGEANFSDHGANRLGASALMQGLADGYYVIPYTIGNYFASGKAAKVSTDHAEFAKSEAEVTGRINKLVNSKGKRSVEDFHRAMGKKVWEYCGMGRNEAGLKKALQEIPAMREEFWNDVRVMGGADDFNTCLEKGWRVADFFEFAELMCRDALERRESCGGHFREEFQTEEGEARRDDANFCHAAVWESKGPDAAPVRHKEELSFESIQLATRSYK